MNQISQIRSAFAASKDSATAARFAASFEAREMHRAAAALRAHGLLLMASDVGNVARAAVASRVVSDELRALGITSLS
jgi:hypothetical protein